MQASAKASAAELDATADAAKVQEIEDLLRERIQHLEAAILKGLKTVSEKAAAALNLKVSTEACTGSPRLHPATALMFDKLPSGNAPLLIVLRP